MMTGREMGCKLTMLLFVAIGIFGFFATLVQVSNTGLRAAVIKREQRDVHYDFEIVFSGLNQYARDHDGALPPMSNPDEAKKALYPDYVTFESAFTRIGDNAAHLPNPALSKKKLEQLKPDTLLFAEAEPTPNAKAPLPPVATRAFLQANGTVIRLKPEEATAHGWR